MHTKHEPLLHHILASIPKSHGEMMARVMPRAVITYTWHGRVVKSWLQVRSEAWRISEFPLPCLTLAANSRYLRSFVTP